MIALVFAVSSFALWNELVDGILVELLGFPLDLFGIQ